MSSIQAFYKRCQKAIEELTQLAVNVKPYDLPEYKRLMGKIEGMYLAQEYLREQLEIEETTPKPKW